MVNHKELSTRVRANLNYKYKPAEIDVIVKEVVSVLLDCVSNGEDINIHGLGKFHARYIKGKKISKTGIPWLKDKEFEIPDRVHLGFSPSAAANRIVGKLIDKAKQEKTEK